MEQIPYDCEGNKIKDSNRARANRKQLCFNDEEIELINKNMEKLGIDNFSWYIRAIACYGNFSKEEFEKVRNKVS